MTLHRLYDSIKCKRTYIGKSHMTAGNAYRITLTYNNKQCRFIFNDNIYNDSKKSDFIACLLRDAEAYEFAGDLAGFMRDFGFLDGKEAKPIYKACEKQFYRLIKLFSREEIELLADLDY